MKIGILGGTFDPIHMGHLILAETAYETARLDRIILMPTGRSYFKDDQNVTSAEARFMMTRLATAGTDDLEISDIEIKRPGRTYTSDTLEEFHTHYPSDQLYYIVGADTLMQMDEWHEPERIFALAHILVATRSDQTDTESLATQIRHLQDAYNAQITLLPVRNIEISSTDIRERVAAGKSIRFLVPTAVESYIEVQGLYRS